jgi:outer membrane protein assembly factor BamD (BamD/ComL family)
MLVFLVVGALATLSVLTPALARKLTRDEIARAAKAAQDKLPAVDQAAFTSCQTKYALAFHADNPAHNAKTLADAAACFRSAGALSMAIALWEEIKYRFPNEHEAREATHQLGVANETAGRFDQAAHWFYVYARELPEDFRSMGSPDAEKDAREHLVRAMCLYRQLGKDEEADRELKILQSMSRKLKVDAATICDGVATIAVPPAPPPATK